MPSKGSLLIELLWDRNDMLARRGSVGAVTLLIELKEYAVHAPLVRNPPGIKKPRLNEAVRPKF